MKSKDIMTAYIQKYKLAFLFLFLLASGVLQGQQQPQIDSMVYTVYEPQYIFRCGKVIPVDLFKAANMYVSPGNGYWGDHNGVPYNGKASVKDANIKEREYTNGNIFTPPVSVADTGMYKFYFYFTSAKDYCGIKNNTRFVLNLYIGSSGCLEPVAGGLDTDHYFCYDGNPLAPGVAVDMNPQGRHEFSKPVTVADLLFTYAVPGENDPSDPSDPNGPWKWKKENRMQDDWVDVDVYDTRENRDKEAKEGIVGHGDTPVKLDSAGSRTYYVIINKITSDGIRKYPDSINITVYPKSVLEVHYSPDDITNLRSNKEYGMDDRITITVDTSEYSFQYYSFILNNTNLNRYYLGGDSTRNEIVLNALAFSGVEDFVEIIATDVNNCIVRADTNVIVRVPFPDVFTPDGDGINDVFLGGEKFRNREFHLEVFNRWGNPMYYGESGWDGTYRGNKAPPGTYPYVLKLKLSDGSTRTIKNVVTLIRESR
ncbi:MAG: gliding motility-associated C-terminal domain-containing protein [Prevotellaceae bacterium]|jgi:gliding motility-associated-like protein|nr:gliding motility-associated C-terminal domain-containing protein [Prevotellaceae bacterium]